MSSATSSGLVSAETPTVVVVERSKLTRRMIGEFLEQALPGARVLGCERGEQALAHLDATNVDLVSTALELEDMDGIELARRVRQSAQRFIPIIAVSGDVRSRLEGRGLGGQITDYFDKGQGYEALGTFIRGYVRPDASVTGHILYVEDSRVVSLATQRLLEGQGLAVTHRASAEDALALLGGASGGPPPADLVLTDLYLKGGMTGREMLDKIRSRRGWSRATLPVVVLTGEDDRSRQAELLRAGANDLVGKPIDERLLLTKLRFQLQVSARHRQRGA